MALITQPLPVKYFIAVLFKEESFLGKVRSAIHTEWGPLDLEGEDHHFDVTDYYEEEMGTPLFRRILSFETLMMPTLLPDIKIRCNDIETELALQGKRVVNLDAGYLDHNKTLLASAKEAGQKIYLDKGIYADLAGRYKNGKYQPFEWSFPDFRDGRYDVEFLKMRRKYLEQIRRWKTQR